ncbi:hypothetical protein [Nocardia neocaledoniensis]|uniref:hypothetical protein n=1 Tax=Nocardia neocaledoniensis TaxID=236511 RepID=UPI002458CE81|nr:hypothetical protein [Nocardia neocaledoniensis]
MTTELDAVDLHIIARLEVGDAAADLYSCEIFCDAADGADAGRTVTGWWESVKLDPTADVSLDALDAALVTAGYRRTTGWRKRVNAYGAVRYFSDATITVQDE